ncbi:tRNA dihydrouridine synthase DusB [Candidatus Peregrinibacteria bacterium]|jgi:tRNA-dihydrouridine synthase B|nr:tRNA dihydrouridine synthase DusB [Candidatus Peregrinibacteria bacterium]
MIKHKIIGLSPMAGYTDSPFRALIRELCPETYLVTELISADGLKYCSKKSEDMMKHFQNEKPLIVQLFGKHPEFFAEAAIKAKEAGAAGIDINMGCPAKKVIQSGHGSSLCLKPELAYEVVRATVEATDLPVTVKTRLGWSRRELNNNEGDETDHNVQQEEITKRLIKFCKGLEDAGASMLCIHGRTVKQEYRGTADWEPIYKLKEALKVPVIGNGDIKSAHEALSKIQNLDGVFIGRAAVGNPWLMAQIHTAINGKEIPKDPDFEEIRKVAIRHAELAWEMKGLRGMFEMRKNLVCYLKGQPHATEFRQKLVHVESVDDVKKVLEDYSVIRKKHILHQEAKVKLNETPSDPS